MGVRLMGVVSVKYTRYEMARIIGARALQIAMGAPPLVRVQKGSFDPIQIAEKEIENGVLPITVVRG